MPNPEEIIVTSEIGQSFKLNFQSNKVFNNYFMSSVPFPVLSCSFPFTPSLFPVSSRSIPSQLPLPHRALSSQLIFYSQSAHIQLFPVSSYSIIPSQLLFHYSQSAPIPLFPVSSYSIIPNRLQFHFLSAPFPIPVSSFSIISFYS